MRLVFGLVMMAVGFSDAHAESWDCTYPGYGKDRRAVQVEFEVTGSKLIDKKWGTAYDIVRDNELAIIAIETSAIVDSTGRRINATTIIIDRERGNFIHMVGEIGDDPGWSKGLCTTK